MAAAVSHIYLEAEAELELMRLKRDDPWTGPNGDARESQRAPEGHWQTWMILAGRGWGKTRTGAEWIRKRVQSYEAQRIILAGPTAADVRDIMVEGESGLLAVCERAGIQADYNPSKRRVTFPDYNATATLVSADVPSRFRGLQCDTFWGDELASWRYPEAWDMLMLGHRLGDDPRGIVTTTPRPIPIIKNLLKDESTVPTRGSTYENAANLADRFMEQVVKRYEGTTLGRQELYAEILEDVEGALWTRALIEKYRVKVMPELEQVAVAVDPATTHGEKSDETGIAVAGRGYDKEFYVPHIKGYRVSPNGWANETLDLYERYEANEIIVESNQGGEMTKHTILTAARDRGMSPLPRVRMIHASRGKRVRAEPVVALYEQGKVHHVGQHASAEDQMVVFPVAEDLDDQVDALVHAIAAIDLRQPRGPIRGF